MERTTTFFGGRPRAACSAGNGLTTGFRFFDLLWFALVWWECGRRIVKICKDDRETIVRGLCVSLESFGRENMFQVSHRGEKAHGWNTMLELWFIVFHHVSSWFYWEHFIPCNPEPNSFIMLELSLPSLATHFKHVWTSEQFWETEMEFGIAWCCMVL